MNKKTQLPIPHSSFQGRDLKKILPNLRTKTPIEKKPLPDHSQVAGRGFITLYV
jgi:hypothetical protein